MNCVRANSILGGAWLYSDLPFLAAAVVKPFDFLCSDSPAMQFPFLSFLQGTFFLDELSSQNLGLSRSQRRRNLGPAKPLFFRSRVVWNAVLALFAFQMMIVTFLTSARSGDQHDPFGESGMSGGGSLKNTAAHPGLETHGPLAISGVLDLASVWKRQQMFFQGGMSPTCPVRPTAPVFITLTTIPSRMSDLEGTVNSLLGQTYPVDILLSIPESYKRFSTGDSKALHEFIKSRPVFGHPRVHILSGADLGPATKLLFPLSRLHGFDASVIPVDDDQSYSPALACDLLALAEMFPGKAVTRRSRVFPKRHCGGYLTSSLIAEETVVENQPRVYEGTDLVMGTSGYLVKTAFFDDSIFKFSACSRHIQDALFLNDDIWVSGHLKKSEVDIVVGLSGFKHSSSYITTAPEIDRPQNASGGLWSDRSSAVAANRVIALNAFFGAFCIPNRRTWGGKDTICRFQRSTKAWKHNARLPFGSL